MADVGAIRGLVNEETLVAADAADGAEAEDAEEPVSERAVRVVE
ncbi:MAG: hypothetical protein JWQ49_3280 [Edaphobacter sp.]|jgi:hypothetical protein|nr:hypothetical protein [Edaphobacter sp.]